MYAWMPVVRKLEHLKSELNVVQIEKGKKKFSNIYKEFFELLGLKSLSKGKALSMDGIPDEVCHPSTRYIYWQ